MSVKSDKIEADVRDERLTISNKLEIMKMVHDHYRMDIEQIWKRGAIYLTINSAAIGLIASGQIKYHIPSQALSMTGVLCASAWLFNALLSHRWIKIWRTELVEIDKDINIYAPFYKQEVIDSPILSTLLRPQISAIMLPLIFIFVWLNIDVINNGPNNKVDSHTSGTKFEITARSDNSALPRPAPRPTHKQ